MAKPSKPDSRRGDPAVGARIQRRRRELELTRYELAERAGVSYPYISQLETGYRNASHRHQVSIASALGVGLDDLFAPDEMRDPTPNSTPEPPPSRKPTLSEVVTTAVNAIETLPTRVRVDALNQIQLRVLRPLIATSHIDSLQPDEVFVFGSNARGIHDGGAARQALEKFGALPGEGHGHHGQSYAIDTMSGFPTLAAEVRTFLDYARRHPELRFLVTPIGTGVAGHRADQVAPLFADVPGNVVLPSEFRVLLDEPE